MIMHFSSYTNDFEFIMQLKVDFHLRLQLSDLTFVALNQYVIF